MQTVASRAEKRAPFSLGLHLFQLLLLVHGNARADYGLDLADKTLSSAKFELSRWSVHLEAGRCKLCVPYARLAVRANGTRCQ